MKNKRILICSCCNSDERKRTMKNIIDTREKYSKIFDGIDYVFEVRYTDKTKNPQWEKLLMLIDHINDGYDYLMWMDDDAGFVKFDVDCREYLPEDDKDFFFTQERKIFNENRHKKENVFLNTGVFFIKCTEEK